MKPTQMNRFGIGRATLTLALMVAGSAPAQDADRRGLFTCGDLIPGDAWLVVGIPDTREALRHAAQLRLTQQILAIFETPSFESNPALAQLENRQARLREIAGFSVSFPSMMRQVFRDLTFFIAPPSAHFAQAQLVVAANVRDLDKARRLIEAFDQVNAESAEAQAGLGAPSLTFDRTHVEGVAVSRFTTIDDSGNALSGFYCLAGERILFSSDASRLARCIRITQRMDAEPALLNDRADFRRSSAAAGLARGDMILWVDTDALMESLDVANLLALVPGFSAGSGKSAISIQMLAEGLVLQTARSASLTSEPRAEELAGARYIQKRPLAALISGAMNPTILYQLLLEGQRQTGELSSDFVTLPGDGQNADASQDLERTVAELFGFSIQDELLPSLGNQWFVALNRIESNPLNPDVPFIDLVLGIEVADAAIMRSIARKIESRIEQTLQRTYGDLLAKLSAKTFNETAPVFRSAMLAGEKVRVLPLPASTGLSPCYAFTDDGFVIVSLNTQSLEASLVRARDPKSGLLQSPILADMRARQPTTALSSFLIVDVPAAVLAIEPFLTIFSSGLTPGFAGVIDELVDNIVPYVDYIAAAESRAGGQDVGTIVVKVK